VAGVNGEAFKPVTKPESRFFPRHGAIAAFCEGDVVIDRNDAGISIEAEREEKTDEEERQKFSVSFHCDYHFSVESHSTQGKADHDIDIPSYPETLLSWIYHSLLPATGLFLHLFWKK
jgi:hypothetical protein